MFSLIRRRPARMERGLARRTAIEPFELLREEMDNMFHRFLGELRLPEEWREPREWTVEETDNEVIMRLELPGFEVAEIEVRREANILVVRAEHPEVPEAEGKEGRPAERYEYRLSVPVGVNPEAITAIYRNGILEVHFPRLPEAMPRRIEVKT